MPKKKKPSDRATKRFTFRMTRGEWLNLKAYAKRNEETPAKSIRKFIARWIGK